ncbi:hypothetical protein [Actinacidiphila glaucinigra]|uniref:hypothetical protein n=1 Tax=Actinacidiphila glaucinigra TaxID=235986 RepID=UPI00366B0A8D
MATTVFYRLLAKARADEATIPHELVDLYRCPVHRSVPLQQNWTGLWVCPKPSHQPNRGD